MLLLLGLLFFSASPPWRHLSQPHLESTESCCPLLSPPSFFLSGCPPPTSDGLDPTAGQGHWASFLWNKTLQKLLQKLNSHCCQSPPGNPPWYPNPLLALKLLYLSPHPSLLGPPYSSFLRSTNSLETGLISTININGPFTTYQELSTRDRLS